MGGAESFDEAEASLAFNLSCGIDSFLVGDQVQGIDGAISNDTTVAGVLEVDTGLEADIERAKRFVGVLSRSITTTGRGINSPRLGPESLEALGKHQVLVAVDVGLSEIVPNAEDSLVGLGVKDNIEADTV